MTVTNPVTGATPVTGTNLGVSSLVYDKRGNTTKLADQTLTYDGADRHLATTTATGTSVSYVRDGTDRIVARQSTETGVTTTVRYGFSGSGDASDVVLTTDNRISSYQRALPGGIVQALSVDGTSTWSYPNIHGDVMFTANGAGARSDITLYDPFGQPLGAS